MVSSKRPVKSVGAGAPHPAHLLLAGLAVSARRHAGIKSAVPVVPRQTGNGKRSCGERQTATPEPLEEL